MNASDDKKESKKASEESEKQNEKKNSLWWKEKRSFFGGRIDFANKKINQNCFSKTHLLKHCNCSIKCCFDHFSKKHHTLLHSKSPHQASLNPTNKQDFTKPDKFHTFLKVIPATVLHGANTTVANALLDSDSDTTLITSELPKILKLKGKQGNLNINIAISTSVSGTPKLVETLICLTHHPDLSERISKAEI